MWPSYMDGDEENMPNSVCEWFWKYHSNHIYNPFWIEKKLEMGSIFKEYFYFFIASITESFAIKSMCSDEFL